MTHPGDLLSALLDGRLDAAERRAVEAHVESCRSCRDELEAVGAARRMLRNLPIVEPPPGLLPSPVRRPVVRPAWAWAAAGAAAAALAVGITLGATQQPPTIDIDTFADQHTARVLVQPGIQTVRAVVDSP